ncbi:phage terminase large subunit family protein [Defluviimonas sp. WL0002]|uniref:Phage terminase large subunit family protein n=1 Tax=Albidovulum marisflavi TaxID=2984159 RepID=A0ABT2ZHN6_9RHOB|nr:phage terminase large subunit family protein [Defluviimonas sp. WL0002]MCV2870644.1 phage terminase large subunit family protein [Defluviimonas sp. WL0002]
MGFLSPARAVVARGAARAMLPPPPPDITRWCEENIVFDERSPLPGPFRIDRFPFLREIHDVLSPEHPAREVTVRGSAQIGKTVSLVLPTLGAWHANGPLDSLVVQMSYAIAKDFVLTKWGPFRRQTAAVRAIFGTGSGDNVDSLFNQETVNRDGSLKVASAGSPSDLTGTTRRLVMMDDLAKWDMTDKGDPEELAASRAESFEDGKIVRISTPLVAGTCRITRAFARSDQRYFHVPCPHCGNMAPLTWENLKKNIEPERLHAACFTCDACGGVIRHSEKEKIVGLGKWVASNPKGDHPGFHLWRAYAPQRDWASIAVRYARIMGWTTLSLTSETEAEIAKTVEAETEQVFWNDFLGLPYEQASKGPDWEKLRDRAENAAEADTLPRGVLPATGFILTAGVDCQLDRTEVQVVVFERDYRRRVIDYIVIPHHIGEQECHDALDALLKSGWRTVNGLRVQMDMMAIDAGAYTESVWAFAKRHPWNRVIIVKGGSSQTGPVMAPMQFDRRPDGKARKVQKRGFILNVSQMKADFYAWLAKDDPVSRGFVGFARAMGDEYYRMVTSEVRVLKRSRAGVTTSQWEKVEPTRRNEGLDTMLYAEAAARRKGWAAMTDLQWTALADERSAVPKDSQPDLFDATVAIAPAEAQQGREKTRDEPKTGRESWFGSDRGKRGRWFS